MTLSKVVKWGNSHAVILPKNFMEFMELEEGDWIDISEIIKVRKRDKKK